MFNKLESIIKNCKGNVLTICLNSKLMDAFKNNNNIGLISIDSSEAEGKPSKI